METSFDPSPTMESVFTVAAMAFPIVLVLVLVAYDHFTDNSLAERFQGEVEDFFEPVGKRNSLAGKLIVLLGLVLLGVLIVLMGYMVALMAGALEASLVGLLLFGIGSLAAAIIGDFTVSHAVVVAVLALVYAASIPMAILFLEDV